MLVDTIPKGKAYESDKAEYGDCWQMMFVYRLFCKSPVGA